MTTYVYTSVNNNYLPKALVLAGSVKQHHPDWKFVLLLVEPTPPPYLVIGDTIAEVVCLPELGIPNTDAWIFKHNIVEACTAVKGQCLKMLLDRSDCERVIYLDPDIVVFAPLTTVVTGLKEHPVVLTPHTLDAESGRENIMDNEVGPLRHGIFNLGFVAANADSEGKRFAAWWQKRLDHGCFDDIEKGIFTDQRWVNLAPAYFPTLHVLRDRACNVATWNINNRTLTGSVQKGLLINGEPLRFYHFTGFDSGSHEKMLERYKQQSHLFELHDWYRTRCAEEEAKMPADRPWAYACYDDGTKIHASHRKLYRDRSDCQMRFANPFATRPGASSFRDFARGELKEAVAAAACP